MTTGPLPKRETLTLRIGVKSIPVPKASSVIVGRNAPTASAQPDIDLGPYGAEQCGVSRRHLRIAYLGTEYVANDLNSSNGTWLNGERLMSLVEYALHDGDHLKLGALEIEVKFEA